MRVLNVSDASWMARLHQLCFPTPWSEASFRELLEKQSVIGFGMDDSALGLFQRAADELEVLTLAVAPQYRRQGLAKTIIEKALLQGPAKVFLEVAAGNAAAMALYRGLGFETIGVRKVYYASGEDAVTMQKTLD